MRRFVSIPVLAVALWVPPAARAQTTDVVVGVPIENGKAGRPQPGVIVDLDGHRRAPQDRVPVPVIVHDATGGTTNVRPNFGGGYTVENQNGTTTTVKPRFGGGYTVEENGRTKTEVKPTFGGGYRVESTQDAPATILVPPPDR